MRIDDVREFLQGVANRTEDPSSDIASILAQHKSSMVSKGDDAGAKLIWRLEQALRAQNLYIGAYAAMKKRRFYRAWCELEKAEIAVDSLEPHEVDYWSDFRLDFIQEYIEKWQKLFPYKYFFSPEFLMLEKTCSVCRAKVSFRYPCGHRVGEIYRGEMCYRIVTEIKPLGAAIVKNPAQKYSVLFLSDTESGEKRDQYNYGLVEYAVRAVRKPFDKWNATWTQRLQPHERFRHIGRNDPCPCGSNYKYKKCCLVEKGVLRPHLQFSFEKAPPADVPTTLYVR